MLDDCVKCYCENVNKKPLLLAEIIGSCLNDQTFDNEIVVDFIKRLKAENKLSDEFFSENIKCIVNDANDRDDFDVIESVSCLVALAIEKNAIGLADVSNFATKCQHLVLNILQNLREMTSANRLVEVILDGSIDLWQLFSNHGFTEKRLEQELHDRDLNFLVPFLTCTNYTESVLQISLELETNQSLEAIENQDNIEDYSCLSSIYQASETSINETFQKTFNEAGFVDSFYHCSIMEISREEHEDESVLAEHSHQSEKEFIEAPFDIIGQEPSDCFVKTSNFTVQQSNHGSTLVVPRTSQDAIISNFDSTESTLQSGAISKATPKRRTQPPRSEKLRALQMMATNSHNFYSGARPKSRKTKKTRTAFLDILPEFHLNSNEEAEPEAKNGENLSNYTFRNPSETSLEFVLGRTDLEIARKLAPSEQVDTYANLRTKVTRSFYEEKIAGKKALEYQLKALLITMQQNSDLFNDRVILQKRIEILINQIDLLNEFIRKLEIDIV